MEKEPSGLFGRLFLLFFHACGASALLARALKHGGKKAVGVVHVRQQLHVGAEALPLRIREADALLLKDVLGGEKPPLRIRGEKRLNDILIFAP